MAGGMGGPVEKKGNDPNAVRWPLWKLMIISCPQLGVQVLWCFIGPNSAPYMKHLGMGSALATLNNLAGPVTGFFTGPFVGAKSDSCASKLGRRRPVILLGLCSLWVAGMLFSGSEHVLGDSAIYFAAPMYWVMDVTINILQTPHRALVADLAADDQQIPMQVVFVFMMAIGNFIGYSVMQIYAVPVDHMLELMFGICLFNTLLVGIQFVVARETPLHRDPDAAKPGFCSPITDVTKAVKDSPRLLYHLAFVQCLVWIGNTAWNGYGGQWFGNAVFEGDENAAVGSLAKQHYAEGMEAFTFAGQCKAVAQLFSTLAIIAVLLNTKIRSRTVYAPCILLGAVASLAAAFVVKHNATFAEAMMTLSIMPETGSFAIPFGLVATLNMKAAKEGKQVSTALQMALLNCCVTIGQQICTMVLAGIQGKMSLEASLPCIFMLAAAAQAVAGGAAMFLDDKPDEEDATDTITESAAGEGNPAAIAV